MYVTMFSLDDWPDYYHCSDILNFGLYSKPADSGCWKSWLEKAPQSSSHNTEPDRVHKVFGQHPQAHSVFLGASYAGPAVGLDDPDGFLPIMLIL